MDDADRKILARIALLHDARDNVGKKSMLAWKEGAEETDEGKLLGDVEVDAIGMLVFARKPLRGLFSA
jgi:hypothetical protein